MTILWMWYIDLAKAWIDVPSTILGSTESFLPHEERQNWFQWFAWPNGLQVWLSIWSFLGVPSHSLGFPSEMAFNVGKKRRQKRGSKQGPNQQRNLHMQDMSFIRSPNCVEWNLNKNLDVWNFCPVIYLWKEFAWSRCILLKLIL